jgi:hypothetical protein
MPSQKTSSRPDPR